MRLSEFGAIRRKKNAAAICFAILCVMIVAAFWPFTLHPANHVAWLSGEDGLRFNGGGIILTTRNPEFAGSQSPTSASLELWLEPSQDKYSEALLSFSSHENPERFRLRQSHDFLLVLQESFASGRRAGLTSLWIPHAFQVHKRRFIVITSAPRGTTVYLDGLPAESSSTFEFGSKDFSGRLILGASPTAYDTWRGKLLGLALFGHELTSAQVLQHHHAWLNGRAEELKSDQPTALYTFVERSGIVVHNQVGYGPDLTIPASFNVLYKPFLKSPWREFYPNQAYVRDVLINIAGFVPLGFFFCMLFTSDETSRKALVATMILGAVFSLTIEVLQGFIPMRDSGTTDIITNTLGTALGAMLYRGRALEVLLGWLESPKSLRVDSE